MFQTGPEYLFSWRLQAHRPLPTMLTMRLAEAARAAAIRSSQELFATDILPDSLHGRKSQSGCSHVHAHWLPEDRDLDGWVDHLTISAPGGFCDRAVAILRHITTLRLDGFGACVISPASLDPGMTGPGQVWTPITPYIGPRHAWRGAPHRLKAGCSAREQLERDLHLRLESLGPAAPSYETRTLEPSETPQLRIQVTRRAAKGPSHPVTGWFEITFSEPITGPFVLGFGAHFGMGQFRSVR